MTPFTGIVLAGGRSARMGCDKALLRRDGETLLDRAIALLRDAGAMHIRVSGPRPEHGGIVDAMPYAGPAAALATVLPTCPHGAVVVLPVDQPDLEPAMLHRLLDALDPASSACFRDHPLPWALQWDAAGRERVAQFGAALATHADASGAASPRGPSMRSLHALFGGVEVDCDRPSRLRNVNTPDDWAAAS